VAHIKERLLSLLGIARRIGFFHLLSANLLIQIVGFGGQIFLTRILSVEDIGVIKILQSYLNIFLIIASLGINTSILKLCSEDINDKERINIFNVGFILSIFSSFSLIILILTIGHFSFLTIDNNINNLLKIYIFLVPILTLINLIIVYLQAQQKIKQISYIQSLSKIIIIIFSTLCAYLSGLHSYIWSLVILNFISLLMTVPFIKNELVSIFSIKISIGIVKKIFNIASFAFGANLLGVLLSNINIIMANYLIHDTQEIGYYSIAQLIVTTMMIIPTTLGQIMIPKISKISNKVEEVKEILKVYQLRNSFIVVFITILAALIAPFMFPIVFGSDYHKSVGYFEVLLIGFISWGLYSPKGITLLSIGRSDLNFYVSLYSFVFNIISNYILIKMYGMYGAAIANSFTYFVTIFINAYFFNKIFKAKGDSKYGCL
jgi:O-antigen/teichoic acid export membrane protein